ncbi:hypothetical protein Tco_0778778 [Tanacetum coccineum]
MAVMATVEMEMVEMEMVEIEMVEMRIKIENFRGDSNMLIENALTGLLKCQLLNFSGSERSCRIDKMNSHKRTIGTEAAFAMSWRELMKIMTEVYCPRNKIQKMETELNIPKLTPAEAIQADCDFKAINIISRTSTEIYAIVVNCVAKIFGRRFKSANAEGTLVNKTRTRIKIASWRFHSGMAQMHITEVPKELPKVSMVNTSLKELKRHLTGFDQAVRNNNLWGPERSTFK